MTSIEQLREQRAATWNRMEALVALAKSENRDLTADERTTYETDEAALVEINASLAFSEKVERNRVANAIGGQIGNPTSPGATPSGEPVARSLGEHVTNELGEQLHNIRNGGHSRFSVASTEFRPRNAATDPQVSPASLSPATTEIDTNIVTGFRRRLTIADLLGQGTLSGKSITYFVEGALEGDFTTVAEGGQKPQIHYADPTAVTEALKKIAAFIKESDEMIDDLPFLASAINNRLLYNLGLFEENQLLSGNGTGTNILGLLNRVGVQSLGAAGDAAAGNPDSIFKAITAVSTATGLDADGIVINPTDYQTLRLSRDANDQYFGGGFFAGQYGQGGIVEQPPLWGLKTVVTPVIAAGTVAVGAFQQATTLYRKGGVQVEATNSNENDFTNNKVTIRAEERVALAVRQPAAIVKLTLGAA